MRPTTKSTFLFAALLLLNPGCNSSGGDSQTSTNTSESEGPGETAESLTPSDHTVVEESTENQQVEPSEVSTTWEEGYRSVFRFVDNWNLLHTYDTGLFVNFGAPAGLKYVQGRWLGSWREGEIDSDRPVAWTNGIREFFRFPLTEVTGDYEIVVRMRGVTDGLRMDVFLNGDDRLRTVSNIPTVWDEVRITLPEDRLIVGENTVRFHFSETVDRTAGGFDYARIQPEGVDPYQDHRHGAFEIGETEDGFQALSGPIYSTFAAYVTVPGTARLRMHVQALQAEDASDVPVSIVVRYDGAEPEVVWEGNANQDPVRLEVDLAEWTDEVIRIDLVSNGPTGPGEILWIDPNIVVPEAEPRVIADEDRPRFVFIWLSDTLTTGHYPVYNPDTRVQAPNFVEFADRCMNFRRNSVQSNSSLPSSASIHSSTYPVVHGVVDSSRRLSRDSPLIIEPFSDAGWTSALFSSNGYVTEGRRFNRGQYTTYRNFIHEDNVRPDSDYVWPIMSEWILDQGFEDPWFIFFNSIDPHVPYDPPQEILDLYHPEPYTGRRISGPRSTGILLDELDGEVLEGDDLRYLVALYDGEITFNDVWFGNAMDFLEEQGVLDDTLVVITSDHGEEFFEHGRAGHGSTVYEEVIDVPLQLCHPRSLGEGRWIDTEVEIIDLFPTLADIAGLEVPSEGIQGESLLPLMMDPTLVMNRPGFSYQQDYLRGMRIGRWKYHFRGGDNDDLFDLHESAIEGEDRRDDYPLVHRYMRDVMAFHLAYAEVWQKSRWGYPNNHSPEFAATLSESVW